VIDEVGGVCPGSPRGVTRFAMDADPCFPWHEATLFVAGEAEESPVQRVPSRAKTGGGLIKPS